MIRPPLSQIHEGECRMHGSSRIARVQILLVDDSRDDADLMLEALREGTLNSQVTVVENGEEAMHYLRHGPMPDLILLDLNMPRMNGHEVLAEVKQDRLLRHIPIIVLTCSDSENAILTAYDLHASCCVVKPANQDQFAQTVRRIELFWLNTARRLRHEDP
jgi:two-component system response regulator